MNEATVDNALKGKAPTHSSGLANTLSIETHVTENYYHILEMEDIKICSSDENKYEAVYGNNEPPYACPSPTELSDVYNTTNIDRASNQELNDTYSHLNTGDDTNTTPMAAATVARIDMDTYAHLNGETDVYNTTVACNSGEHDNTYSHVNL